MGEGNEEIQTLEDAGTWELIDLLEGTNVVSSKSVFCIKRDATGHVVHYKACLVVQGFSHIHTCCQTFIHLYHSCPCCMPQS